VRFPVASQSHFLLDSLPLASVAVEKKDESHTQRLSTLSEQDRIIELEGTSRIIKLHALATGRAANLCM